MIGLGSDKSREFCRSLIEIQFFINQVGPAVGSVNWLVVVCDHALLLGSFQIFPWCLKAKFQIPPLRSVMFATQLFQVGFHSQLFFRLGFNFNFFSGRFSISTFLQAGFQLQLFQAGFQLATMVFGKEHSITRLTWHQRRKDPIACFEREND